MTLIYVKQLNHFDTILNRVEWFSFSFNYAQRNVVYLEA